MNEVTKLTEKAPFIKTTNEKTANKLIVKGFSLITQIEGVYIFANDSRTTFDKSDDVEFSNIMYG